MINNKELREKIIQVIDDYGTDKENGVVGSFDYAVRQLEAYVTEMVEGKSNTELRIEDKRDKNVIFIPSDKSYIEFEGKKFVPVEMVEGELGGFPEWVETHTNLKGSEFVDNVRSQIIPYLIYLSQERGNK